MENSNALIPFFEDMMKTCGTRKQLILDLYDVHYIASMGVGLLTTCLLQASKNDLKLALQHITPSVRSVLQLLGFLSFFDVIE
jgi:anti-anti-sigma factor